MSAFGNSREDGFTLLEMLVVVAIVALVASVALPMLSRPPDSLRLQAAANELLSALRATRMAAIVRGGETVLTVDVDQRRFESLAVPPRELPADVTARLTFASIERVERSQGGFRFFPDGSSTGGDITLSLHGYVTKICVSWVTGQARREPC